VTVTLKFIREQLARASRRSFQEPPSKIIVFSNVPPSFVRSRRFILEPIELESEIVPN
jgi:hypothetical protein